MFLTLNAFFYFHKQMFSLNSLSRKIIYFHFQILILLHILSFGNIWGLFYYLTLYNLCFFTIEIWKYMLKSHHSIYCQLLFQATHPQKSLTECSAHGTFIHRVQVEFQHLFFVSFCIISLWYKLSLWKVCWRLNENVWLHVTVS